MQLEEDVKKKWTFFFHRPKENVVTCNQFATAKFSVNIMRKSYELIS